MFRAGRNKEAHPSEQDYTHIQIRIDPSQDAVRRCAADRCLDCARHERKSSLMQAMVTAGG